MAGNRPGRELVFGDPVVALSHAAGRADLVVVGGATPGPPLPGSMTARLAARLTAHRLAGTTAYGRLVTVAIIPVGYGPPSVPSGRRPLVEVFTLAAA